MDLSKAAAALGRKGGQARGPTKRRVHGTPEEVSAHMRRVRAARPKPQIYESRGDRGGYSVREGLKGWIVDIWSTVTGTRTGERWLVPYSPLSPTLRLDAPANYTGTLYAEIVVEERQVGRCLRRGHVVR